MKHKNFCTVTSPDYPDLIVKAKSKTKARGMAKCKWRFKERIETVPTVGYFHGK